MSLTAICEESFRSKTRRDGQTYFKSGRARIVEKESDYAEAVVQGTEALPYMVAVDWSRAGQGNVRANCTCPHYDDGNLCKHIWAAMLQIDRERLCEYLPMQRADVQHDSEATLTAHWGESPFLPPSEGDQEENWEEGDDDSDTTRVWKSQLNWIKNYAPGVAHQQTSDDGPREGEVQVWYAVNEVESRSRAMITLDLYRRTTLQNGNNGKAKRLTLRPDRLDELADDDRKLVELLLGNQVIQKQTLYSRYETFSKLSIPSVLHPLVLPNLCASGRLIWQPNSYQPMETGVPLRWDDGDPWRFRLRAEENDQFQLWSITGELYRGEETRPLGSAVVLFASGIVMFEDCFASLGISLDLFAWVVSLRNHSLIQVPFADRNQLLERLFSLPEFPEIEPASAFEVEQVSGTPQGVLRVHAPNSRAMRTASQLNASVGFRYDERYFGQTDSAAGTFDSEQNCVLRRDFERESELVQQLSQLGIRRQQKTPFFSEGLGFTLPAKRLTEVVEGLTALGWLVESQGIQIRRPGKFNLSVRSDVDWFELSGELQFEGSTITLPELLRAVRDKREFIQLDDGSHGILPREWLSKFGHLVEMAEHEGEGLRFAPSQALLLDALLAEQEQVDIDRPYAEFRERLLQFEGVDALEKPRGFQGELREYQKEGLGWLHFLQDFHLGGCLADDMGLGKTVQVLAMLQGRRMKRSKKGQAKKPSLVVVPKSLIFNWIEEAERFTPNLKILNYTGKDRRENLEQTEDFNLLLTTYGTLRRDVAELSQREFDYAILDESQAIKNHQSQAAKACRLIKARHRLAMTGTPVENHLGELWSLFEFLNPGMLGRSAAFQQMSRNGSADSEATEVLAKALRPFLLRRTKEQVLTELPAKTEQTLYCEMAGKERKEYEQLRDYYRSQLTDRVKQHGLNRSKIHVLEALLRLRQAACHPGLLDESRVMESSPKLETVFSQLDEVIKEGHKALVFSQFTSLLSIVRQHLDQEEIVYEYLDGRTRKRGERVKRFQTDPDCPLFLISLKAGGHGLNLTAADYVFILDPWWNPAVEAQAIDRAHRIGQVRPVFAYRIICRDTVEDKIVELQKSKRELADAIVSADNSLVRNLTSDDIELLLS